MAAFVPLRGSSEVLSAGKTYCQAHSRAALGYLRWRALGDKRRPTAPARSWRCSSLTRPDELEAAGRRSGRMVTRSRMPLLSRTVIWR